MAHAKLPEGKIYSGRFIWVTTPQTERSLIQAFQCWAIFGAQKQLLSVDVEISRRRKRHTYIHLQSQKKASIPVGGQIMFKANHLLDGWETPSSPERLPIVHRDYL